MLGALDELRRTLEAAPRHPLLGHSAVRVSRIQGGDDVAMVAAECRLTIERRMLPGESVEAVERQLRSLLDGLAAADPELRYTLTRLVGRDAFQVEEDWPVVQTVRRHAERVQPAVRGEPFWTDAGLTHAAGIPSLLVGVAGGGAHTATEWVEVASVHRLTEILTGVIIEFCG